MSALTANYPRSSRERGLVAVDVAASTTIFLGSLSAYDTSGNLVPAADTAGLRFAGIAEEPADNSGGSAGDLTCKVRTNRPFKVAGSGFTAADVGKPVFAADDNSVALTSTNLVYVGDIQEVVSATEVWVDPTRATSSGPLVPVVLSYGDVAAGQTALKVASFKLPAGRAALLHGLTAYCKDQTDNATVDAKVGTDSLLSAEITLVDDAHTAGALAANALAAGAKVDIYATTAADTGAVDQGEVTLLLELL